jgi:TnpA family transposase
MSSSISFTNKPRLAANIYPNKKAASFWARLKVAWRIVWYGDYYPAPYAWYETLYPIVSDEYSHFAEMAVEKSEHEFKPGVGTQEQKRKEALEWMRHYAEAHGKSTDIRPWLANFLVEWWVARKKGWI